MFSESTFLNFFKPISLKITDIAQTMEQLIYQDPASAIGKARLFLEEILGLVYEQEGVYGEYKLVERINRLSSSEFNIDPKIRRSFDLIRIAGNHAIHDGTRSSIQEALRLHKEMYNIAVWFCELYTIENVSIPEYKEPRPIMGGNFINELLDKLSNKGSDTEENKKEVTITKNLSNDKQKLNTVQESLDESGNTNSIIQSLNNDESMLIQLLNRLKDSSQAAVEHADSFSDFKKYLHVKRSTQVRIEEILEKRKKVQSNLILLSGSVGDGKSHLLAFLKENKNDLIGDYKVYNDGTESYNPTSTSIETLSEILKDFSDQRIETSSKKVILAINLGVLHNFIYQEHKGYTYEKLRAYVEGCKIFTSHNNETELNNKYFDIVSFSHFHPYELTKEGPKSEFFSQIMRKIFSKSLENPFYLAYQTDTQQSKFSMVHENYEFLLNEQVQNKIVDLVINTIIMKKLVVSARDFLNFLADIIIPSENKELSEFSVFEKIESSVPSLLFERQGRSKLLNFINELDPISIRSIFIDNIIIEINTDNNLKKVIEKYFNDNLKSKWLFLLITNSHKEQKNTKDILEIFSNNFIRLLFLTNKEFANKVEDETLKMFTQVLYFFNKRDMPKIQNYYNEVKNAVFAWNGSPKKDYIFINDSYDELRLAQKIKFIPEVDHLKKQSVSQVPEYGYFYDRIRVVFRGKENKPVMLEIDYPLFNLLSKVKKGYKPDIKDKEDAIKFLEFIDEMMDTGEKTRELLIYFLREKSMFKLKQDDFNDGYVFERE